MSINIGLSDSERSALAQGLSVLLADTYMLYLKTHNYHWNVVGPMFNTLHLMFEQQYQEIWLAIDEVAERIRALDFPAPGSTHQLSKLATISELPELPDATGMIRDLVAGQEALIKTARNIVTIAEKTSDQPTLDLLTRRLQVHEKNAWMLRSLLG